MLGWYAPVPAEGNSVAPPAESRGSASTDRMRYVWYRMRLPSIAVLRRPTDHVPRVAVPTAVMIGVALLLGSCVTDVTHNCIWGPTVVKVRYEVTSSTGMADIELHSGESGFRSYRREQTPWSLTQRVRGETSVLLRVRNSRPLGNATVAIYVDDVLWKRAAGVGSGAVEATGVIESEPGWNCGTGMFMQTYPDKPAPPEKPAQPTVPQEPAGGSATGSP